MSWGHVTLHHPHLYDLDEAGEDRIPAHSDQRHVGKHLWDHHGCESRHLSSTVRNSPISPRLFSPGPLTFPAVLSREACTASPIPEPPAQTHVGWRGRCQEICLAGENSPDPHPAVRSEGEPAASSRWCADLEVGEVVWAYFMWGPGAGIEPRGLELALGRSTAQGVPNTVGSERHRPVWFYSKGRISVQLSRSAEHPQAGGHVGLELSKTRDQPSSVDVWWRSSDCIRRVFFFFLKALFQITICHTFQFEMKFTSISTELIWGKHLLAFKTVQAYNIFNR